MLGEIERLRELVEKWRIRVPGNAPDSARVLMREYCADELEALLRSAAFEEMARDADRYRWLRDLPEGDLHEQIGNFPGDMWDAAIDAAREKPE